MNKHRGEIFRQRFEESGIMQTTFCNSLGISLNTLTNWFNNPNLGWEKLLMAGEIIAHDFSEEFPLLKHMKYDRKADIIHVSEPVEAYKSATTEAVVELKKNVDSQNEKFEKIFLMLEKINKKLNIS